MTERDPPSGLDLARIPVREPPPPKAKRFYKDVTVAAEAAQHRVLLDGRPVKTPLRRVLESPHRALVEAVAAEWRGQGAEIDPESMPLTRLMSTALDRVATERPAMTASLLAYIDTDLLCYRAPHPKELTARQAALWQPILDWLEATHGIGLKVVEGVLPVRQSADAVAAAERAVGALGLEEFTVLQAASAVTGSLTLALALVHGRITGAEAFAAAHVDETFQNEQWGEDAEAMERRRRIGAEIAAVGRYLDMISAR